MGTLTRVRGSGTRTGEALSLWPLPAGTLTAFILWVMKLRLRKARGHTAAGVRARAQTQADDSRSSALASPYQLPNHRKAWKPLLGVRRWVPFRRQREPEANSLTIIPGIIPILQIRKGNLQKSEIICPKSTSPQIAELGFKPRSLAPPSAVSCLSPGFKPFYQLVVSLCCLEFCLGF